MQYRSAKGFTGGAQAGILLAFLGAGLILVVIIQTAIFFSLMGGGMNDMTSSNRLMNVMMDPKNSDAAKLLQVLSVFALMFIPSVAYLWICHGKNWKWLGFFKPVNIFQLALGFLIMFCCNLFASMFTMLSKKILAYWPLIAQKAQQLEADYLKQVTAMGTVEGWGGYFLSLIIIAFLPALFEEMLFRGVLQNLLTRWWKKPIVAIVVTSIVFSLVHMSYYNFMSRFILGFELGWMFYISRNIWVNIVAHFLNNALAATQLFWLSKNNKPIGADTLDDKVPLAVSIVMALVLVGFCYFFWKVSVKNRTKIMMEEEALYPIYDVHTPFLSKEEVV